MEENRNTENEKKKTDKKKDKKFTDFWNAHKGEFKKITWPSREELLKQTATVIVVSLIVGAIIFAYDRAILFTYEKSISMIKGSNSTANTQPAVDAAEEGNEIEDETSLSGEEESSDEAQAAPAEDTASEEVSLEGVTE